MSLQRSESRSGSLDGVPQQAQPVVGGLPGGVRLAPLLGTVLPGCRIRPEELDPRQPGVQVPEAVGDDLVADVAGEIDDEAVVAQALLGRAGLELGQVDVARRELSRGCRAGCPGWSARWKHTMLVLSWPVGLGTRVRATRTNRVWLSGWSSTSSARMTRP